LFRLGIQGQAQGPECRLGATSGLNFFISIEPPIQHLSLAFKIKQSTLFVLV
jgi:hypothetical protein